MSISGSLGNDWSSSPGTALLGPIGGLLDESYQGLKGLTGEAGAEASLAAAQLQYQAAQDAIAEQQRASAQGLGFLEPYGGLGLMGVEQAGFLTDPQAQFDFLKNNPLFQLSLDNANRQTQQITAARGRLSAGDTLQQLSNNVLLSATPLLDRQTQNITNLLELGRGVSTAQANTALGVGTNISNLLTGAGDAAAAGQIGAANAYAQGGQNMASLAGIVASFFAASDRRLKKDIKYKGKKKGHNWYSFTWNDRAKEVFNLEGNSEGVMADEAERITPDAVIYENGYRKVNYSMLGLA